MSEDASIIPIERVEQSIYLIRGHKVMLDRDLAGLYGVETRALNQVVKRNVARFPDDFMFELSRDEIMRISQFVIPSETPDIKYSNRVFAFAEQDVAMLAGVLKSPRVIDVNIAIMRTFVKLRRMLESSEELSRKLAELESRYDEQFRIVFVAINELMIQPEPKSNPIGFHVNEEPGVYTVRKI